MKHDFAVKSLAAERYLLGEMPPEERDEFEAHYFECQACALEVRAAAAFEENVREVLDERERRPARSAGWFSWLKPNIAYPVFASVLVAGLCIQSVALLKTRQSLADATAPRLVASAVLPPETRGVPVVVYAGEGQDLLLTFDVTASADYSRYRFEIESASGATIFQLDGSVPRTNEVSLSIPAGRLSAGRYTLVIRGISGETASELSRRPFEIVHGEKNLDAR